MPQKCFFSFLPIVCKRCIWFSPPTEIVLFLPNYEIFPQFSPKICHFLLISFMIIIISFTLIVIIYGNFNHSFTFAQLGNACDNIILIIRQFWLSDILLVPWVLNNRECTVFKNFIIWNLSFKFIHISSLILEYPFESFCL